MSVRGEIRNLLTTIAPSEEADEIAGRVATHFREAIREAATMVQAASRQATKVIVQQVADQLPDLAVEAMSGSTDLKALMLSRFEFEESDDEGENHEDDDCEVCGKRKATDHEDGVPVCDKCLEALEVEENEEEEEDDGRFIDSQEREVVENPFAGWEKNLLNEWQRRRTRKKWRPPLTNEAMHTMRQNVLITMVRQDRAASRKLGRQVNKEKGAYELSYCLGGPNDTYVADYGTYGTRLALELLRAEGLVKRSVRISQRSRQKLERYRLTGSGFTTGCELLKQSE